MADPARLALDVGIGSAPALVFGVLLCAIPESPRSLIEQGQDSRAREILRRVGGQGFAAEETASIRAALAEERGGWGELFSAVLRRPLAIGIALAILQQVSGINVFMYFGATIFKNLSSSTGVDAGLLQQVIINGSGIVFTLIAIAVVDHWGRKPLILVGTTGMGLSRGVGWLARRMTVQPRAGAGCWP